MSYDGIQGRSGWPKEKREMPERRSPQVGHEQESHPLKERHVATTAETAGTRRACGVEISPSQRQGRSQPPGLGIGRRKPRMASEADERADLYDYLPEEAVNALYKEMKRRLRLEEQEKEELQWLAEHPETNWE